MYSNKIVLGSLSPTAKPKPLEAEVVPKPPEAEVVPKPPEAEVVIEPKPVPIVEPTQTHDSV